MEAVRESWPDDRIDDLDAKVDRVDADVRGLRMEMKTEFVAARGEMREGFEAIERRFDKIDARFDKVDERFEKVDDVSRRSTNASKSSIERIDDRFQAMDERLLATYRMMMMGFCGLMFAALIGLIAPRSRDRRGDLARLLLPVLAAAQHALGEDRDAEDRGRAEAELDAEQALAGPVDVAQIEQQRRLVEGQAHADAHRRRPGGPRARRRRSAAPRCRSRRRAGCRGRSGGCGGRRP